MNFLITILFNYHDSFQLSQSFSIITVLFNHPDPFQLSRSSLLQSFLSQFFSISLQLVALSL